MRAVLQRVKSASVTVDGRVVGAIGPGVLALVAATHEDTDRDVATMARKIADLRMLADDTSLSDHAALPDEAGPPDEAATPDDVSAAGAESSAVAPAALVVSQFTLYGTTQKGRRPSWSAAAPGPVAEPLVDAVAQTVRARGITVETGVFGAQMDVALVNDGPFTLIVDT